MRTRIWAVTLLLASSAALAACSAPQEMPAPVESAAASVSVPMGELIRGPGWNVTITAVEKNATAVVAAANEFNPTPGPGERYVLVNVTLERTAATADPLDVDITLVHSGNRLTAAPAVAPVPLRLLGEFPVSTPVSAQVAFLVPERPEAFLVDVSLGNDTPGFTIAPKQ